MTGGKDIQNAEDAVVQACAKEKAAHRAAKTGGMTKQGRNVFCVPCIMIHIRDP